MPILYAGVVNKRKEIILEGYDNRLPSKKSNYAKLVTEQYEHMDLYGKKTFDLDDQHSLHYSHEGSWAVVVISQKPDVTIYEAMNFIDRFKDILTDEDSRMSEVSNIQASDAGKKFKKFGGKVSDLITSWNADPANRDRAYVIF